MKKQVYEIDENGYIKEIYVKNFKEGDNFVNDYPNNIIVIDPQNGLYRARWINGTWIEDMTQQEIDALNNQPVDPSEIEELSNYVLNVDFRVVMLEMGL